MFKQVEIFTENWRNLLFEGRNKEYGAYELRKDYSRHIVLAIIFSFSFFVLLFTAPIIARLLNFGSADERKMKVVEVTTLAEPPPIDKSQPPPPEVPPPPPLKTTIKFTPPVIVKDEEVIDEPLPTQDQLKEVDPGTKTQEGDSTGVDLSLLENKVIGDDASDKIFLIVEQMPDFPGGEKALLSYLATNIKYPVIARQNGITGPVYVGFVVTKEGKVSDVKIQRGIGGGCDEEAVRVVQSMPQWKPGKQNGVAVSVRYTLAVNFTLE